MNFNAITVSQLNSYVKFMFDGNEKLNMIFLKGEISNFTDHYSSGHMYFSLKDEKSLIKCVMFSSSASHLKFKPQNGMKVISRGKVSLYSQTGQYQFYCEDMQPLGIGALTIAFEQQKEKLQKEGLFDTERKKLIPRFPKKIAVITSPTGAAVMDITSIIRRRYPCVEIDLYPVQVQGEDAAKQISDAINECNIKKSYDTIIVGRGGGSIEDLWSFNEEIVVRAVADSQIPVISCVGHETDFTLCDFAADLRAPTPSAAAELAVPDKTELNQIFNDYKIQLNNILKNKLKSEKSVVEDYKESIKNFLINRISKEKNIISTYALRLEDLSPLKILSRGYSIVSDEKGKSISSSEEVNINQKINIKLDKGNLICRVEEKI